MDDVLSTGNILALVAIAGVVLPLLKKHWYRFAQLLWTTAMVMIDAKIIRWVLTSDYLLRTRLIFGIIGAGFFTYAFVWAIRQVQRDMSEAAAELRSLTPIFAKLTDFEKAVLRQVVVIGRSTRALNAAEPVLVSIAEKTGFVTRTWIGHYELNQQVKEPLRALLADDRSSLVSVEPGVGLAVSVKSEGRELKKFRNNEIAGVNGRSLEGLELHFDPSIEGLSLTYMGHFEMDADVPPVNEGEFLHASDASYQLEGFEINLTGPQANNYRVFYSAHAPKFGNYDEREGGEFCGSRQRGRSLDTMIVRVIPRE